MSAPGSGGDQASIIERLSRPEAWDGREVERIDTHISALFLVGDRVYKLKRAVKLPFVDFSNLGARHAACQTEVEINRRTARDLYLGVRAVTADGRVDGSGATVDWVVEMRRFDGNDLFDKLAEAGRLDEDVLEATAVAIARFHEAAVRRPDLGGAERVAAVIDGIEGSYPDVPPAPVSGDDVADVLRRIRELAEQWSGLIDARRDGGFVRDVHGDLHLRNIVLWRGAPTLFDALEFDERLRCSDCAYDIAFLLMDLMHRDMGAAANFTLNVYFRETDDLEALALLPLFIGMRAAIRGHVAISTARHSKRPPAELAEAQAYVELARRTTAPAQPAVVAVGGLSGTGKSTVARGLAPGFAPGPGALVLRSDEIRKQLAGVRPADRLGKSFYTAAWSDKIYATMVERCRRALAAGWPVVADAVYGDPAHRVALAQVAAAAGAPFTGLWLEAPRAIALERVGKRRNDASDADVDVAAAQSAARPSETGWRVVDAGGTVSETIARARAAVGGPLDGTDRAGPGKAAPAGP